MKKDKAKLVPCTYCGKINIPSHHGVLERHARPLEKDYSAKVCEGSGKKMGK